jgi:hypothetical protein
MNRGSGRHGRRIAAYSAVALGSLLVAFVAVALAEPAARPAISGNPWVGQVLTSSPAGDTGVYKWQTCDPATATCGDNLEHNHPDWADIPTGNGGLEYTLTPADLGMMIRIRAKGTSLGEQFTPSAPVGPVTLGPPPPPPVNISPPTISGEATEAKSLTANPGEWQSDEPPSFSFSWERCSIDCTPIDGADEERYDPTAGDVGKALRVEVTAANSGGEASEYSERTDVVAVAPPVLRVSAVIDPECPLPVAEPGEELQTVDQLTNVPTGTKIDVSACAVEVITVRNSSGKTQSVTVAGGPFKFFQLQKGKPVVILKLAGKFTAGPTAALAGAAGAGANASGARFRRCVRILGRRKCRRLVARGDCLCSTSGRFASGTVRGSKWYVQDGPGYTFTKAIVHKLLVRDKVRKKKILLKQGQSYTARKKRRR